MVKTLYKIFKMIKINFFTSDCTLRDGGYYNNWNFGTNLIQRYLNIMAEINIDYVEIGFRSLDNKELKGLVHTLLMNLLIVLKYLKN